MLNELLSQLRRYEMVAPGDHVICAVSGGADSMALLWGMYLLKDKLDIRLSAAHFNHHLRGEESQRDEQFVRDICQRFDIPLFVGEAQVVAGKKGLEAAARDARYRYFDTLDGIIATAHTADDNAETLLMHLVRGTGLKGLGGIAPVMEKRIRPMLNITRSQVLAFLEEYHIPHVEDSSNETDAFLRNRLRHRVMPLLTQENPRLAENLSQLSQRLRQDEQLLASLADGPLPDIPALREMPPAQLSRVLERFLKESGVREPEAEHIRLARELVFSQKPSASAAFPGGITVRRCYDRLEAVEADAPLETIPLPPDGCVELPEAGLRVRCCPAEGTKCDSFSFTVGVLQDPVIRCRQSGDTIRLPGGTKSLKKLFIDRKIPAHRRKIVPVIADEMGIVGVYGIGVDAGRAATSLPATRIIFEPIDPSASL